MLGPLRDRPRLGPPDDVVIPVLENEEFEDTKLTDHVFHEDIPPSFWTWYRLTVHEGEVIPGIEIPATDLGLDLDAIGVV